MPWLYLLGLSIVILIVWWALSRNAAATETPEPGHDENPTEATPGEPTDEHEAPSETERPEGPVE